MRTLRGWLRIPGVKALIAISRFEQRTYNLAQRTVMNNRVYETINKILATKVTADTIGPIVSMCKFVYNILNAPQDADWRDKKQFNINVGVNNSVPSPTNPYQNEQKIANVTPKQLAEMKRELDELERLAIDYEVEVNG